jgi:hypothetical protein
LHRRPDPGRRPPVRYRDRTGDADQRRDRRDSAAGDREPAPPLPPHPGPDGTEQSLDVDVALGALAQGGRDHLVHRGLSSARSTC